MGQQDTKERILDAAERLFADHGFAATSLRTITGEADVNLAAVNYHFGSKEALIQEIFERRVGPLNEKRLGLLDEVERAGVDGPPSLERIVEAFVGPALRMSRDPDQGIALMRLVGHSYSEPSEQIRRMFHGQFKRVAERFHAALGRALPGVSGEVVFWRMLFMVGAMAHTMAFSRSVPEMIAGVRAEANIETTIRRLVAFLVAGMRAPA